MKLPLELLTEGPRPPRKAWDHTWILVGPDATLDPRIEGDAEHVLLDGARLVKLRGTLPVDVKATVIRGKSPTSGRKRVRVLSSDQAVAMVAADDIARLGDPFA